MIATKLCLKNGLKTLNTLNLFLVIALLFSSTLINAQSAAATIDSNGQVIYERAIEKYSASIIIGEELAYNSYDEPVILSELIDTYFKKLGLNGVDATLLKEDKEGYALMGYRKKGVIYRLETKHKDEFFKVISTNSDGVQVNEKYVYYTPLTNAEVTSLSKKSIALAKDRASLIAATANKKVGEVVSISGYYEELKRGFYGTNDIDEHYFNLSVKFELK